MTCKEFLEQHSEFVDEVLAAHEALRMIEHIESCESCARYDSVVRRGASLLRELEVTELSPGLPARVLAQATRAQRDEVRWTAFGWSLAAGVAVAAIAWSPLARQITEREPERGIDVTSQLGVMSYTAPGTYVDPAFADAWVSAPAAIPAATRPVRMKTVPAVNVGPYSPLIVQPPAFEAAPPPRRVVWDAAATLP